ncbi:MAG: hypothetical protein NTW59_05160 [Candidatus Diapherotrites archaeon]|nr:hypothetical protein [Candidatus Diapherotrites archaeon]
MNGWTHIILEAYCARKWNNKKNKYWYELIGNAKEFKTKKVPNPHYDQKYKTPKKPGYCPGTQQYICLEKGCPHLAYTNALEEDYLFMNRKYKKRKSKKAKQTTRRE